MEQIDDLANWRSVIAWGAFEELAGKDEQRAPQLLVNRLMRCWRAPLRNPAPARTMPKATRTTRPAEHPSSAGSR